MSGMFCLLAAMTILTPSELRVHVMNGIRNHSDSRCGYRAMAEVYEIESGKHVDRVCFGEWDDTKVPAKMAMMNLIQPLTVAIAIEEGVADMDTLISTKFSEEEKKHYDCEEHSLPETIPVKEAIDAYPNVAIGRLGTMIGYEKLKSGLQKFGFEITCKPKDEAQEHITTWAMAVGKNWGATLGDVAKAYAILANRGSSIEEGKQIISPETADAIVEAMRMMKWNGKGGVTQKKVDGEISNTIYYSTFVGLAPIREPKYVIAIMIERESEPGKYSHNKAAARAFRDISQETFRAMKVKEAKAGLCQEKSEFMDFLGDMWHYAMEDDEDNDGILYTCGTVAEYTRNYKVIYADKEYVSIYASEREYTGGAHSNGDVYVMTINRKLKRFSELGDFISEDKHAALEAALKAAVIEKVGGEEILIGEVKITNNFYYAADGIHFVYSEYEVAPFIYGAIDVVIDPKKL